MRYSKCNAGSNERGFSLLEMLVIIGIIAILAAVAAPTWSSYVANYRLKAAASDLFSDLQKARLEAIKTNSNVAVSFNAAAESYQINGRTVVMPAEVDLFSVTFVGSTGFTPKGLPFGSTGTVRLTNTNNRWYQITITMAGGVRLQKGGADTNGDGIPDSWN